MSGLPWYRCYPRDFNDGMVGLTLEERGAYVTILNVIYAKGAPIDDDPGYFRALLCCSARTWTKVRAALIVKRKLFEVPYNAQPCLMNRRAATEIAVSEEKFEKFSEAGRRGGRKSQANRKENNTVAEASLEAASSISDTDTEQIAVSNETVAGSPRVPSSPSVSQADIDAIWTDTPAKGRERSGRRDLERALKAAAKRGHAPAAIRPCLRRYYASDEATRADGQYAKGVHRLVEMDRWQTWAEPEAQPIADWPESRWRAAVEHFAESRRWSDACGPSPAEPRCRAPPNVLAEFGFAPLEVGADPIPFRASAA